MEHPPHNAAPRAPTPVSPARRRNVGLALCGLVVLCVVVMLMVWSLQRMVLFPRFMIDVPAQGGAGVPGLVRVAVQAPDGPVEGWILPGDGTSAQNPGPAVIFAHGNGEIIDHWPEALSPYRRLGITVMLPEYRGYGRSAGAPSEDAITEDFTAFYDLLALRDDVDASRIVFHGRSLGGGAVCALARHRKPRAMILMSTFTGVAAVARRYLVPSFMIRDRFDNLSVVAGYDGPVLVLHGRQDELVPFSHGEKLAAAAPQGTLWAVDATHNDCPPDWEAFYRRVEAFLREAGVLR